MAIYVEDFSSETIGAQPSNWTNRWRLTGSTLTTIEDPSGGSPSVKVAQLVDNTLSVSNLALFTYDPVISDADRQQAHVLVRVRPESGSLFRVIVRGGGSAGAESGYVFEVDFSFSVKTGFYIYNGTGADDSEYGGGDLNPTTVNGEWHWVRAVAYDDIYKLKVWREVEDEPDWQYWVRDDRYQTDSNAGWIGIAEAGNGQCDISHVFIATDKDAADQPTLPTTQYGVRTTNFFAQVITKHDSDVQVTQSFLKTATQLDAEAQLGQTALLALWGAASDFALIAHSAVLVLGTGTPCVTRWTQIWTITRIDGVVYRFTTLDVDFEYGGNTYLTCGSLASSAAEGTADLRQVGNVELNVIINSSHIKDQDVLAGLLSGATVEAFTVPWDSSDTTMPTRIISGEIGRIEKGTVGFNAEIVTPAIRAQQQNILDVYSPQCRFSLGDSRCQVDVDALEVSGAVTGLLQITAPNAIRKRGFVDTSRAEASGYFDYGQITFTSGDNNGVTRQIETFDGQTFVLWDILPYRVQIGDTYTAKPGCDKTFDTCKTKYSNGDRYGGFPHVPGSDALQAITTRQSEVD